MRGPARTLCADSPVPEPRKREYRLRRFPPDRVAGEERGATGGRRAVDPDDGRHRQGPRVAVTAR